MKRLKSLFLILTLVVAALFSACAQEEKLQTPKNLEVDVDNNLTWSEVSGARTYTVEVTNADTAEKEEKNACAKRRRSSKMERETRLEPATFTLAR